MTPELTIIIAVVAGTVLAIAGAVMWWMNRTPHYEHDESGITTEDPVVTKRMQDARLQKEKDLARELNRYECVKVYGNLNSSIAILCWGSNKGVCVEAAGKLGLKVIQVERLCLARRKETIETDLGPLDIKIGVWNGDVLKVTPEYESCRSLAEAAGLPLAEVYARATVAIRARYH